MFYYISFLRPPALQVLPSSPSRRTSTTHGLPQPARSATEPIKLTTWRLANAYKEITVHSPPGIRDGQSWRLILCSEPQRISINLEDETGIGKAPFPVISMPIEFTRNANKNRGKQERIERHYRFTLPNPEAPQTVDGSSGVNATLRITEQTSFDLDKKIWDSGIGLSAWLVSLANTSVQDSALSSSLVKDLRKVLFGPASRKIIELGAGTGIVALTLGALRSGLVTEDEVVEGCIITTDLPSAMPLLEHNVSANSNLFAHPAVSPRPEVLDWDAALPSYSQDLRGHLDAIIMADVTYNTASFPALIRTLTSLIELNSIDEPPTVLLGYKERDSAERSLWMMAEKAGIHFERVGEKPGAGGAPIEIWIGKVHGMKSEHR
ncbi:hypothetical protein BT96DRAFT_954964 [Gymnopus androsaceus JB14]|uniref:Methyltransferase-domain-containing protein n=1 Tax=Gymnopus androsaceus JB14 TaxID=1447944 RepID=A0A6A4I8Y8_9AGAR|nr:hypothetical protein BT96DRAFT_954964 [Gymnopus androsaceus JB14]